MNLNSVAKYHALGNDYIVADPKVLGVPMTGEAVRLLCDRHFGVGSDGVLYGPLTKEEPYKVRIFNPDGSEAEKSGNGLRIFAKYLADAGYTGGKANFDVQTVGGLARVTLLSPDAEQIEVDMGTVSFYSTDIPVTGEGREVISEDAALGGKPYRITCLTIGNPHCVIFVRQATKELALELGPQVENDPMFPERINLQLAQVIDRSTLRIEIWERGAGYTLASGSSSCAAAAAAYRLGLTDDSVTVRMPGGEIGVRILPDGSVLMRGGVSAVFEARLYPPLLKALGAR